MELLDLLLDSTLNLRLKTCINVGSYINPCICIVLIILGNYDKVKPLLIVLIFASVSLALLVSFAGNTFKTNIEKYIRGEIIGRVGSL